MTREGKGGSAAIDRLGFVRNDGASRLRSGRTETIGLILEDLADPFYSAVAAAVERVCRERHHLLITGSGEGSAEREQGLTVAFVSRRVAGLLAVPAGPDRAWLAQDAMAGTPVVFLDRPASGVQADTVLVDNEGGVRSAVEHLAAHGHRHIGFLGDHAGFWTASRRRDGFQAATSALGLRSGTIAMGPHDREHLAATLRRWTGGDDPVTAVLTGNNRVTVVTLRALRDAGVDLAVVGFDDFELADLLVPPVTVVAQDPAAMGERAARLLFQRLDGDTRGPRSVVLPTRLIVRASGSLGGRAGR